MVSEKLLLGSIGVIHVGAHDGQERAGYARHNLKVLWIEPCPSVFEALLRNIAPYPRQHALELLITNKDGEEYDFHIASNAAGSSSIFGLGTLLTEAWPEISYTDHLRLKSRTLDSLLAEGSLEGFDSLVLDVQGSELLVLRGAIETLKRVKFVQAEAYDAPLYEGGALVSDVRTFLESQGFHAIETEWMNDEGTPLAAWHVPPSGRTPNDVCNWYELVYTKD